MEPPLCDALEERSAIPVTAGTHGEDLTLDRKLRLSSLCPPYAFACMHGYSVYSAFSRGRLDVEVVPFLAALAAAFARKPVLFSEFGNPTCPPGKRSPFERVALPGEPPLPAIPPDDPRHATYACLSEDEMAAYCTQVLERLHADGRLGAYWWCWADYASELAGEPPFDRAPHEMSFGIVRSDGSEKPVAHALARFAAERRTVLAPGAAALEEAAYYSVCRRAPLPRTRAGSRNAAAARGKRRTMRENPLKQRLAAGETVVGMWLSLSEPLAAEALASLGWDWLLVDMEHGPIPLGTAAAMVTALRAGGAVPFVRPAWNESSQIQRVLDLGAYGIVVPVVNTVDDARAVVRDARFFPLGERSRGGVRANLAFETDAGTYGARANDEVLVYVQIETETAVANADEIASVDGIDGLFVGPNDLAAAGGKGWPEVWDTDAGYMEMIAGIPRVAERYGKTAGFWRATLRWRRA